MATKAVETAASEMVLSTCNHCGRSAERRSMLYQGPPDPYREPENPKWWWCDLACAMAANHERQVNSRPCMGCGTPVRREAPEKGGRIPAFCERSCRDRFNARIDRTLRRVATGTLPTPETATSSRALREAIEALRDIQADYEAFVAWWRSTQRPVMRRGGQRTGEITLADGLRGQEPGYVTRLLRDFVDSLSAKLSAAERDLPIWVGAEALHGHMRSIDEARRVLAERREGFAAALGDGTDVY
jgi:hypothetical protein